MPKMSLMHWRYISTSSAVSLHSSCLDNERLAAHPASLQKPPYLPPPHTCTHYVWRVVSGWSWASRASAALCWSRMLIKSRPKEHGHAQEVLQETGSAKGKWVGVGGGIKGQQALNIRSVNVQGVIFQFYFLFLLRGFNMYVHIFFCYIS